MSIEKSDSWYVSKSVSVNTKSKFQLSRQEDKAFMPRQSCDRSDVRAIHAWTTNYLLGYAWFFSAKTGLVDTYVCAIYRSQARKLAGNYFRETLSLAASAYIHTPLPAWFFHPIKSMCHNTTCKMQMTHPWFSNFPVSAASIGIHLYPDWTWVLT